MPAHDDDSATAPWRLYTWSRGQLLVLTDPDGQWQHADDDDYLDWLVRRELVIEDRVHGADWSQGQLFDQD